MRLRRGLSDVQQPVAVERMFQPVESGHGFEVSLGLADVSTTLFP